MYWQSPGTSYFGIKCLSVSKIDAINHSMKLLLLDQNKSQDVLPKLQMYVQLSAVFCCVSLITLN